MVHYLAIKQDELQAGAASQWLRHLLLLHRTKFRFPDLCGDSQSPVMQFPGDPIPFSNFHGLLNTSGPNKLTQKTTHVGVGRKEGRRRDRGNEISRFAYAQKYYFVECV